MTKDDIRRLAKVLRFRRYDHVVVDDARELEDPKDEPLADEYEVGFIQGMEYALNLRSKHNKALRDEL